MNEVRRRNMIAVVVLIIGNILNRKCSINGLTIYKYSTRTLSNCRKRLVENDSECYRKCQEWVLLSIGNMRPLYCSYSYLDGST